ncbi:MAG: hypothetical protein A3F54_04680 [Candidatus Kerfeldbacteria bacterium RIFCSPHIGHO2_12_FULL_48_17]|uniref:Nudix hydrolase domain-containing protein n=1 Tax=Candidatus Kerfeldbacteria bacterium RIFCSPHIGHO2_12_FULL_48_17 TaxID=1798542 RepID=A0A1G2AY65_9BACT|nr:MAG: hypothetical protein A3F54_04680 [Candidatus Kerfeldbacteria bacterium RIFCSPHIGHO2_12_FULL_48_17]
MKHISLRQLNDFRRAGLRPQVVGCFVKDRQVLFVYVKKHKLWQLPQGGVENNETLEAALEREMTEELGPSFMKHAAKKRHPMGEDVLQFPKKAHNTRDLRTDSGKSIKMRGKKYFFFAIPVGKKTLRLRETEFNDYRWLGYIDALNLTDTIYQKEKQKKTQGILKNLRQHGWL